MQSRGEERGERKYEWVREWVTEGVSEWVSALVSKRERERVSERERENWEEPFRSVSVGAASATPRDNQTAAEVRAIRCDKSHTLEVTVACNEMHMIEKLWLNVMQDPYCGFPHHRIDYFGGCRRWILGNCHQEGFPSSASSQTVLGSGNGSAIREQGGENIPSMWSNVSIKVRVTSITMIPANLGYANYSSLQCITT